MYRSALAILVAALGIVFLLTGTYEAFFVLASVVPQGVALGVVVLCLGILCVIGCAAVGCTAYKWFERGDRGGQTGPHGA